MRIFYLKLLLFFGGITQSCVTDNVPEGGILNDMGSCFKKIEGELRPIKCPKYERPILSTDQRMESVERFRNFMVSTGYKRALEMSRQRDKDGIVIDHTMLNDYGDELKMMVGDRYIVMLYFRNYSLFPTKYYDHDRFKVDSSESFRDEWTHKIFERYLGKDYERFEPKLGIVHDDRVGIRVLVDGIKELEKVIYRDPLFRVTHIGDPIYPLEETLP